MRRSSGGRGGGDSENVWTPQRLLVVMDVDREATLSAPAHRCATIGACAPIKYARRKTRWSGRESRSGSLKTMDGRMNDSQTHLLSCAMIVSDVESLKHYIINLDQVTYHTWKSSQHIASKQHLTLRSPLLPIISALP